MPYHALHHVVAPTYSSEPFKRPIPYLFRCLPQWLGRLLRSRSCILNLCGLEKWETVLHCCPLTSARRIGDEVKTELSCNENSIWPKPRAPRKEWPVCPSLEQLCGSVTLSEDMLSEQVPATSLILLTQDCGKPVLHQKKRIRTLSFISSLNSNKVITHDRWFLLMKSNNKVLLFVSNFWLVYMFISFNFKTNVNIYYMTFRSKRKKQKITKIHRLSVFLLIFK